MIVGIYGILCMSIMNIAIIVAVDIKKKLIQFPYFPGNVDLLSVLF